MVVVVDVLVRGVFPVLLSCVVVFVENDVHGAQKRTHTQRERDSNVDSNETKYIHQETNRNHRFSRLDLT